MCPEPTKVAAAPASASLPHAESAALPRIEYSSSEPCALTRVGRAARGADRAAEQDVVAEDEVGRKALAQRGRVPLHPAVELRARAVLEELHLVALVPVEHEDRQEAGDVRPHRLCAAEVVLLRLRLLAEDGHVVPRARPLPRERACVDVRARTAEQVPVPEKDPHAADRARSGHVRARTRHVPRGHVRGQTPARSATDTSGPSRRRARSDGSRGRRGARRRGSRCARPRRRARQGAPRSS